jgi:hypothetical protein
MGRAVLETGAQLPVRRMLATAAVLNRIHASPSSVLLSSQADLSSAPPTISP